MAKFKYILLSERRQSERATYCDSNYMIFWNEQNYRDSNKISSCQVLEDGKGEKEGGREGGTGGTQEILRTAKLFFMVL